MVAQLLLEPGDPGLLVAVLTALAVVAGLGAVLVAWRGWDSSVRRQRTLERELAASRTQVDDLARAVEKLSVELHDSRTSGRPRDYLITSFTPGVPEPAQQPPRVVGVVPPRVGEAVEDRLVAALVGSHEGTSVPGRTAGVLLRSVALAHGVRRALSPDVLDRAAAEAQVARRRSRRLRKQELREVRRVLRVVKREGAA